MMRGRVWDRLELARPRNWVDELCYNPSVTLVSPFDMPFDDTGAIIVDILQALVGHIDERNIIKIPLVVV